MYTNYLGMNDTKKASFASQQAMPHGMNRIDVSANKIVSPKTMQAYASAMPEQMIGRLLNGLITTWDKQLVSSLDKVYENIDSMNIAEVNLETVKSARKNSKVFKQHIDTIAKKTTLDKDLILDEIWKADKSSSVFKALGEEEKKQVQEIKERLFKANNLFSVEDQKEFLKYHSNVLRTLYYTDEYLQGTFKFMDKVNQSMSKFNWYNKTTAFWENVNGNVIKPFFSFIGKTNGMLYAIEHYKFDKEKWNKGLFNTLVPTLMGPLFAPYELFKRSFMSKEDPSNIAKIMSAQKAKDDAAKERLERGDFGPQVRSRRNTRSRQKEALDKLMLRVSKTDVLREERLGDLKNDLLQPKKETVSSTKELLKNVFGVDEDNFELLEFLQSVNNYAQKGNANKAEVNQTDAISEQNIVQLLSNISSLISTKGGFEIPKELNSYSKDLTRIFAALYMKPGELLPKKVESDRNASAYEDIIEFLRDTVGYQQKGRAVLDAQTQPVGPASKAQPGASISQNKTVNPAIQEQSSVSAFILNVGKDLSMNASAQGIGINIETATLRVDKINMIAEQNKINPTVDSEKLNNPSGGTVGNGSSGRSQKLQSIRSRINGYRSKLLSKLPQGKKRLPKNFMEGTQLTQDRTTGESPAVPHTLEMDAKAASNKDSGSINPTATEVKNKLGKQALGFLYLGNLLEKNLKNHGGKSILDYAGDLIKGAAQTIGNLVGKGLDFVGQGAGSLIKNIDLKSPIAKTVAGAVLVASGATMAVLDALQGEKHAKDWGVSAASAQIGGALGGMIKNRFANMGMNGLKYGLMGAGIGLMTGNPIAALIGGVSGLVIGGVMGAIGAEKIAQFFDKDYKKSFRGILESEDNNYTYSNYNSNQKTFQAAGMKFNQELSDFNDYLKKAIDVGKKDFTSADTNKLKAYQEILNPFSNHTREERLKAYEGASSILSNYAGHSLAVKSDELAAFKLPTSEEEARVSPEKYILWLFKNNKEFQHMVDLASQGKMDTKNVFSGSEISMVQTLLTMLYGDASAAPIAQKENDAFIYKDGQVYVPHEDDNIVLTKDTPSVASKSPQSTQQFISVVAPGTKSVDTTQVEKKLDRLISCLEELITIDKDNRKETPPRMMGLSDLLSIAQGRA